MNYSEDAIRFACDSENLLGIVTRPAHARDLGVVVVVGGPQTRVGSHRQFALLARRLAVAGYPTLRFDYRGMGDSTGAQRDFESVTPDIRVAIGSLQAACPTVKKVALWGLCDAASASLLYWDETRDPRIAGFCMLNPWVRSAVTLARTQVKHYYIRRLLQKKFWLKLLAGRLAAGHALAGLYDNLRRATQKSGMAHDSDPVAFQDRMARVLKEFPGRVLLILSGQDYTAKEFLEYARTSPYWAQVLARPLLTRADLAEADHTFSNASLRQEVEELTSKWLQELASQPTPAASG